MATQMKCPSCSTVLRLPDGLPPGGAVRCPKCSTVLRLPGQAPASAPLATLPVAARAACSSDSSRRSEAAALPSTDL